MKIAVQNADGQWDEPKEIGLQDRVLIEMDNGDTFFLDDVPDNAGSFRITCVQRSLAVRPTASNVLDVSRA